MIENNRQRAQRSSPDERRELILQEACQQCLEEKRKSLSLIDIARRLGISRSLVYHYFPNQESLMAAIAEKRILGFLTAPPLPTSGTAEERLTALFMGLSDYMAQAPEYLAGMIRTTQGRAVLDSAVEEKIPQFIQLEKQCLGGDFSAEDDEILYALAAFIRLPLARNSNRSHSEREQFVKRAVKATIAAMKAVQEQEKSA